MEEPRPSSKFMDEALEIAVAAMRAGEVPVGALVVKNGEIIARSDNRTMRERDPTAHAEILALREAGKKLKSERLIDCDLYVTLEPCTMCAAAISFARIRRLYYGAADPKGGAVESGVRFFASPTCHHAPEVYGGIQEARAGELLRLFFRERREP
jgi:tRNA(Arg) A34 adenosine deaminase TadA